MSRTHSRCFLWQGYADDRYMIFYKSVCCLNANGSFDPQETDTNRIYHESSFLPRLSEKKQYIHVETDNYVYQIVLWVLTHFPERWFNYRRVVKIGFGEYWWVAAPLQRVANQRVAWGGGFHSNYFLPQRKNRMSSLPFSSGYASAGRGYVLDCRFVDWLLFSLE